MRKTGFWITVTCLFALTVFVWAQATRKPGLWEMTTTMNWQKSPLPPGVTLPPGMASPFSAMTHTSQVCLTQAMIDKYGAPMAQTKGDCQINNVVLKPNGMTANMVCNGQITGTGTIESTFTGPDQAKGKVHFIGSLRMGPNTKPVEWTVQSSSVFKSADCGDVKPASVPDK